ncbi:helix-turn-helix domain-containing protein [Nannocystis punicea]|uniref:Helix-turn-helix domain-containing protein n=1 Tax=Nannocystis punicea TaxID=2995304 RepID=A0ABY7HG71_9BACT|nr:helix-turn-helix domain-containing protein [Nannocystis poenicansa]WAS98307.1 helix-turn-helix domain-containing protein [Nannocystis poenicansa]
MEISIKDAADLLGKSERTVRHMAQTGRLPARRVGSRWLIDRDDLMSGKYSGHGDDDVAAESAEAEAPAADVQEDNFDHDHEDAEASISAERPRLRFDRALPPGTPSVRALDSFHIAADLLAELGELRRDLRDAPHLRDAEQNLRGFIQALADGIHADLADQPERFRAARTQVCAALTDLIHFNVTQDKPDLTPLVDRVEHELLGSLQVLIGTATERSSWRYRVRGLAERTAARVFSRLRGIAGEGRVGARLAALEERFFGASAAVTVN